MRGLTLHQPWASLVAEGRKEYETRSWSTLFTGLVAIHAGKEKRYLDDVPFPALTIPWGPWSPSLF